MKVIVRHASGKVVLQPICKAKAVEPARSQQIEIPDPQILVVKPRLVLELAAKITAHTTHFVCRLLFERLRQVQRIAGSLPNRTRSANSSSP